MPENAKDWPVILGWKCTVVKAFWTELPNRQKIDKAGRVR